jgi:hypothetical protein
LPANKAQILKSRPGLVFAGELAMIQLNAKLLAGIIFFYCNNICDLTRAIIVED